MEEAVHFLQTPFWAEFKGEHGWESLFFGEKPRTLALVRRFRFFSLVYIPMFYTDDPEVLCALPGTLRRRVPKNTVCIRVDPEPFFPTPESRSERLSLVCAAGNLKKAVADVQPPDTVLLDLTRDEEALLSAMKPKWRYNIRLAAKNGVTVRQGSVVDMDAFYALYQTTAKRDKIAIHAQEYYEALLCMKTLLTGSYEGEVPDVRLYLAEYRGELLAGIITVFTKREGIYLYGASGNEKRNLMPSYLLQWQAIRDAKVYGCAVYDFYGVPPSGESAHPMRGLWRFKTGFGGAVVHRLGSLDLPLSPLYALYRLAETLRTFWYKGVLKVFRRN